jgi:hypothetical protein
LNFGFFLKLLVLQGIGGIIMVKKNQEQLVRRFIREVKEGILRSSHKWPEGWDGLELRQLVIDSFSAQAIPMTMERSKNYNNDVIVNDLL